MSAQAFGWKKISDPADTCPGLTALVGPFVLTVHIAARDRVTWDVRGLDVHGANFEVHGVTESVQNARIEALAELKRQWSRLEGAIERLEGDSDREIGPQWNYRPGLDGDVATADVGPFRLYAFSDRFAIRGPMMNREGSSVSTEVAQRTTVAALRKHLAGLSDEEIEGHRVAKLLWDLESLERLDRRHQEH